MKYRNSEVPNGSIDVKKGPAPALPRISRPIPVISDSPEQPDQRPCLFLAVCFAESVPMYRRGVGGRGTTGQVCLSAISSQACHPRSSLLAVQCTRVSFLSLLSAGSMAGVRAVPLLPAALGRGQGRRVCARVCCASAFRRFISQSAPQPLTIPRLQMWGNAWQRLLHNKKGWHIHGRTICLPPPPIHCVHPAGVS